MSESDRDIDAYAAMYQADAGFERELVRLRRKHVLACMSDYAIASVLEIGCGLEPLFEHTTVARHVTVEPATRFVARARELAADKPHVRVVQSTIEQADLAGEHFDFVLLSGMLHEVPSPSAVLQAVARVCDRETIVHVNVPNARSFHRLLALELGLIRSVTQTSELGAKLQRISEFDRASLRALVEAAGFRVVREASYALKPFTHAQMEQLVAASWCPPGLVDGLDRMVKYMPELGSEISIEATLVHDR